MKTSNDTIGNRTHNRTACSAVPQPAVPPKQHHRWQQILKQVAYYVPVIVHHLRQRIKTLNFMFCWPCISIHLCNKNQLHELFILSLFCLSTSTCSRLQIWPKHVEVDWQNKLRIQSASSWFLLRRYTNINTTCTFVKRLIIFTPNYLPPSTYAILVISFIHLAVCLTTGPKPLPKRALHLMRSRASSFKWEYPLLSLRSSSSFLHLLPRLHVTSISLLSFLQ